MNHEYQSRQFLLSVFFVTLLCLMVYSYVNPGVYEAKNCLSDNNDCTGLEAQFTHDTKVIERIKDGFVIEQSGYQVVVWGNNEGLMVGDGIQFRGVWLADGTIEVSDWHISRQRNWRIYLSLAAWLLMVIVLHKTFRFDMRSMTIYSRRKET